MGAVRGVLDLGPGPLDRQGRHLWAHSMTDPNPLTPPSRSTPQTHQRGQDKVARIPIKVERTGEVLRKPAWIRARAPVGPGVSRIKRLLRESGLVTVCEEAQCPNLGECFNHGTATFMILGDICTRRCPFCDVAHGRPQPVDPAEPEHLAQSIAALGLRYVVITSVDRDDLRDGGAGHFAACLRAVRARCPGTRLEVLVPDFRGREAIALAAFAGDAVPDVFNHNLETVPRLYAQARPGADYLGSLRLLADFKAAYPQVPDQVGAHAGSGGGVRRGPGRDGGSACPWLRHADPGAVSAAQPRPPAGAALLDPGGVRRPAAGG